MIDAPTPPPPPEQDRLAVEVAELVAAVVPGPAPGAAPDPAALLAGLDSLGRLELLTALEARFDVELTEDLIPDFESPERIARIIRDVRSQQAGSGDG